LQQVIERIGIERTYGVLVEGRRKDDERWMPQLRDNIKRIQNRHLDIQEGNIRLLPGNQFQSLDSIQCFSGNVQVGMAFQQAPHENAGKILIIDENAPDHVSQNHFALASRALRFSQKRDSAAGLYPQWTPARHRSIASVPGYYPVRGRF